MYRLPRGHIVAASTDTQDNLTGGAAEVSITEGDKLFAAGTHTTYGTWEAFEAAFKAQQELIEAGII